MTVIVHKALLADIEAAIAAAEMSKAEFGVFAVNDPRLVFDLKKGRELRSKTQTRVTDAIERIKARP